MLLSELMQDLVTKAEGSAGAPPQLSGLQQPSQVCYQILSGLHANLSAFKSATITFKSKGGWVARRVIVRHIYDC